MREPAEAAAQRGEGLRRAGLLAAFLYALGAAYLLVTVPELTGTARERTPVSAAVAAATSGVLLLVPWRRLPTWTSLLAPLWAFVVLLVPIGLYSGALSHYLLLYTLLFLYVGLTQPRWTSTAMLPLALGSLVPAFLEPDPLPATSLLGPVLVAVLLGELLALLLSQQRRAQRSLGRLLAATEELHGAPTTAAAADAVAALARDLLGAERCDVLLRADPSSPLLVDVRGAGREPVDTSTGSGPARAALQTGRVQSAGDEVHLPLGSAGSYEGVAIVHLRPKQRLDRTSLEAAQVLATSAGQVLRRTREAQHLQDLATTDPLTGLPNRRTFFARLAGLAPQDCVAFLDLDHFKRLNDRDGHAAGDAVLRSFGAALAAELREQDLGARYGGEEFAVLLPATSAAGAVALLERLRTRWKVEQPGLSFSAGVALRGAASPTETLAAADAALYDAKRQGRDRTCAAAGAAPAGRPVVRLADWRQASEGGDAGGPRPARSGAADAGTG